MSSTISFTRLPLPGRQLERQHLRRRLRGSDRRPSATNGFSSTLRRVAPPRVADLEEEELLEDQPPLRRRPKRVELVDRRLVRREVRLLERRRAAARAQAASRRSARQQVRRCPAAAGRAPAARCAAACSASPSGLLVERHDARRCARSTDRRRPARTPGFMKCRPVESSFTSPKTTTCRCGFRMSARNA